MGLIFQKAPASWPPAPTITFIFLETNLKNVFK